MKKLLNLSLALMMLLFIFGVSTSVFAASTINESEDNGTYATADKVEAGDTACGVIDDYYDHDYYKFVAPSNGKLSVDFLHTYDYSDDCWDIDIYRYADGEYNWVSGKVVALNGNEKQTVPFVGTVKGGVYYIIVKEYDGYSQDVAGQDYKLKFNFTESNYYEKEDNDTYAEATKVSLDSRTYTGTINSDNDVDYYKMVAPADGYLDLAFIHNVKTDDSSSWDIYVYSYYDGAYTTLSSTNIGMASDKTTYVPTVEVKKGRTYFVRVNGGYYKPVGEDYKLSFEFCMDPISSLKATPSTNSVKLSWNKLAKADSYQIQQYKNNKWKTIATTESTSYTVKNLSKATEYKFRVRASAEISGKTYYSAYWKVIYTATKPGSTTLKATAGTRKVTLSWNKVTGADGYVIYRATSKNGTYNKVTSVKSSTTKYTNTGLTAGKMYYYKVRAYVKTDNGYVYGAYSSVKSARPTLATPTLKLTAGTKKVTLSWDKVTGASGYVIYRSTSKNGTYSKVATIKSGSTTQYTNKNLTAKKTYYYKMRAYVKVGDTYYYSPYSTVKSVKTK